MELNYILNCGYDIKRSYDPQSDERDFSNCLENPEKYRTLKGCEPVTSRCRCDALTNWAIKPQTVGADHLWVQMFLYWMNQLTKWYMKCVIRKIDSCQPVSLGSHRLIRPWELCAPSLEEVTYLLRNHWTNYVKFAMALNAIMMSVVVACQLVKASEETTETVFQSSR